MEILAKQDKSSLSKQTNIKKAGKIERKEGKEEEKGIMQSKNSKNKLNTSTIKTKMHSASS